MNKICTDISQSNKLIELGIDVNTADMVWIEDYLGYDSDGKRKHGKYRLYGDMLIPAYGQDSVPAWSLNALEKLMPFQIIENNERYGFKQWKGYDSQGETYCFEYISNIGTKLYETYHRNTPLDSAFEMVVWLKENGKL